MTVCCGQVWLYGLVAEYYGLTRPVVRAVCHGIAWWTTGVLVLLNAGALCGQMPGPCVAGAIELGPLGDRMPGPCVTEYQGLRGRMTGLECQGLVWPDVRALRGQVSGS